MQARDVMTKDVVMVGPEATVGEIAALLVKHRIGAVPVVSDDGHVIGLVSQTDLVHRSETGTEKRRKWWLEALTDPDIRAQQYVKTHGHKAQDVMTRVVISVSEGASLSEVADTLDTHGIRQVPVLGQGRLAGIISRADLVRTLAEASIGAPTARPDSGALQKAIWEQIRAQPWLKASYVNLAVKDGVVELWGAVESEDQRRALKVLVEGVKGVEKIQSNVTLLKKVFAA
jgi:CBS domain-containing protein